MTTAWRLNEAAVKPIQRGRGVLKRTLFHGGVFAPPGYSEITHIVSLAPRDLMTLNNQYFTGDEQFQWLISSSGTESPPPFGFNMLEVSTSRSNTGQWVMTYRRVNAGGELRFRAFHIPSTMLPIYINPSHYIPTELTIARYGRRSNVSHGSAIICFYRLPNETADPFFFHDYLITRYVWNTNRGAIGAGIVAAFDGLGISSAFSLPALANGAGAVQAAYFGGYGSNNTTANQEVMCSAHTFPFPIRANLFNTENTGFDPLVRIAVVPIVFVSTGGGLEHYPVVTVKVKCKAAS